MLRTQLDLTEAQHRALKRLARTTGRPQSRLIRTDLDARLGELRHEGDQRITRSWRRF